MQSRKLFGIAIQLKYAFLLTLMTGLLSLIMIFVMAWFIQRNYNLFMRDELGVSSQVIEIVRHEQELLEASLFILFLGTVTIMFGSTFYVVRKLTGPIVALERQLRLYAVGDWSRSFRLRKNDEFRELEGLVNHLRTQALERSPKVA